MNSLPSLALPMRLAIGLFCLFFLANVAWAGGATADAQMPLLNASIFLELVSDRSRLVQISCVCVALGCAIIWWYK